MTLATWIVALLLIGVGGAFLLAGYRLYRLLIPVWGFLVGFELTVGIGLDVFQSHILTSLTGWMLAALVGLIFGALAYGYYYLSVALLSGSVGFLLGEAVVSALVARPGLATLVAGIVGAALLMALAIRFNLPKALVVVFTAIGGAAAVVVGVALLIGRIPLAALQGNVVDAAMFVRGSLSLELVTLALAVVGAATQVGRLRLAHQIRATVRRARGAPLWPTPRP